MSEFCLLLAGIGRLASFPTRLGPHDRPNHHEKPQSETGYFYLVTVCAYRVESKPVPDPCSNALVGRGTWVETV
jgi:hypothetical protein